MKHCYQDILERIGEDPIWWDENAVPRYEVFQPGRTSNVYAGELVLLEIACQSCGENFHVAMSVSELDRRSSESGYSAPITSLKDRILNGTLGYGDPPNKDCCASGPTMSSESIQVLEYWKRSRETDFVWQRFPELEIPLPVIEDVPDSTSLRFEIKHKVKIPSKIYGIFGEVTSYLKTREDWPLVRCHQKMQSIFESHFDRIAQDRLHLSETDPLTQQGLAEIVFMVDEAVVPERYGMGWALRWRDKGFHEFFHELQMTPITSTETVTIEAFLANQGISIYQKNGKFGFTTGEPEGYTTLEETLIAAVNSLEPEVWLNP